MELIYVTAGSGTPGGADRYASVATTPAFSDRNAPLPALLLNPVSGHIDRRETLHAGDDVGAVHLLQALSSDAPVELWRDGRKVSRQDGPPNPFRDRVLARASGSQANSGRT